MTNRLDRDLEICPEGYVCTPTSTTSFEINNDIGSTGKPSACPDKHWCDEGVLSTNYEPGDYSTPQKCKDGVICGQTANGAASTSLSGSVTDHGIAQCPIGKYCQEGGSVICDKGTKCPFPGQEEEIECSPGFYSNLTGGSSCSPCPIGTFCL